MAAPGAEPAIEAVGVYARIRPAVSGSREELADPSVIVSRRFNQQKTVQVRNLEFSLDWVWDAQASQSEVYELMGRDRVARVLQGYNVALLAYGQTGSGKTFTMFGPDEVLGDWHGEHIGLAPRAVNDLFSALRSAPATSQFVVTCSYVEVYNDECNDLLGLRKNLALRETADHRLTVEGLSHQVVSSAEEVMAELNRGNANRVVAAMKMNERSSRSHAIFSLVRRHRRRGTRASPAPARPIHSARFTAPDSQRPIPQRPLVDASHPRAQRIADTSVAPVEPGRAGASELGKLQFVDLAGMESSKKSYSVEGPSKAPQRREEAKNINRSLYSLGTVIERLAGSSSSLHPEGHAVNGNVHVPYRDSKLTRLLQESLGGNCAAAIIVTLRAEPANLDETIGTKGGGGADPSALQSLREELG